ncbi:MAG: phosphotransferase family protein [Chloroflexi bacterium]|nr:phosphotransferase family protein [Chloroflexota bacterium]
MDTQEVARYLQHKVPRAQDIKIIRNQRISGGVSRQTWLVNAEWVEDGARAERGFVFRRMHPGGASCPTPLWNEFMCHKILGDNNILPIAKGLWFEHEYVRWFDGCEFYVREQLDGNAVIPGLHDQGNEDLRISVAKDFAENVAKFHMADWKKLGFADFLPEPVDDEDCFTQHIERWLGFWRKLHYMPFPTMTEALTWLKANKPKKVGRICLLKGDIGIGNEVYKDGKIQGMSDWELCSIGDPAKDWDWALRRGVGALWEPRKILDYYEQLSGIHISEENLRYARVQNAFELLVIIHPPGRNVIIGKDLNCYFPFFAISGQHGNQKVMANAAGFYPNL